MFFIHIADLHLGMEPDKGKSWSKQRARELWDAFDAMIAECQRSKPELLLISGDLFHRQPLVRELKEAGAQFASIPDTRIVIVAGNHDYISGTSGYKTFKWSENVHFLMSEEPECVYFPEIETEVWGLSYHTRDVYEARYAGCRPSDPSRISILAAHGGDPSDIPIDWKELSRAGFDYIAMGHIHKPQDIADNIRYSGSPEPLDKNENGIHGYIVGEISVRNADMSERSEEGASLNERFSDLALTDDSVRTTERKTGERTFITTTVRTGTAKRQYVKADIEVDTGDTNSSLRRRTRELIEGAGTQNYYILTLKGEYDPATPPDIEGLNDFGNICELIDESRPRLDFEALRQENAGNVIGLFIEKMLEDPDREDEIHKRALYCGVMALIENK